LIAAVATGTPIEQAIQNAIVSKASSEVSNSVAQARNAPSIPDEQPKTYEDLMAGIVPSTPDRPSTGPSNDEILKQIGYEPEPTTVQQEPANIDQLLRSLQPYIENPPVDNLINQAVTDTLGTKNADETATGRETTMDDIDLSSLMGSLDAGPGAVDLSNIDLSNLLAANTPTDNYQFNPDDYKDAFASGELSDLLGDSYNFDPNQYADAFASGDNLMGSGRYESNLNTSQLEKGFNLDDAKAAERERADEYDPTAALPQYGVQDLGISQTMIDEFNKNYQPAGGFGSQWQTVGTNKVMVNDDGTSTILDPTTGQSSYLTPAQTAALIKNGTLNTKSSGYVAATGGTGSRPGGSRPATSTAKKTTKTEGSGGNKANMIMALMAMMAMMNDRGKGSSGSGSVIPALQANRTQLPYSRPSRPGAGGQNYFSPTTYTAKAAEGGLMGLAGGGMSSLGGYSDGGRLLRGPGDGVSDSIPATIGGKQPARLAEGEFVVPARIVSELGNGSTNAGAKKLYAMMDRVQNKRRKTKNVAADTKAHKNLPA
jgi:hypothetical protein